MFKIEIDKWGDPTLVYEGDLPQTEVEALELSIDKWSYLSTLDTKRVPCAGRLTCGLCMLYNASPIKTPNDCLGCPVYKATGSLYCLYTPYEEYDCFTGSNQVITARAIAQREKEFLASLRVSGAGNKETV